MHRRCLACTHALQTETGRRPCMAGACKWHTAVHQNHPRETIHPPAKEPCAFNRVLAQYCPVLKIQPSTCAASGLPACAASLKYRTASCLSVRVPSPSNARYPSTKPACVSTRADRPHCWRLHVAAAAADTQLDGTGRGIGVLLPPTPVLLPPPPSPPPLLLLLLLLLLAVLEAPGWPEPVAGVSVVLLELLLSLPLLLAGLVASTCNSNQQHHMLADTMGLRNRVALQRLPGYS